MQYFMQITNNFPNHFLCQASKYSFIFTSLFWIYVFIIFSAILIDIERCNTNIAMKHIAVSDLSTTASLIILPWKLKGS